MSFKLILCILLASLLRMPLSLTVTSPAFEHGKSIPAKYTCEGADINPELVISGVPKGTKSLALIMDDPDAPKGTFDHWIMWNIPVQPTIGENSAPGVQGKNGTGKNGYKGPCPPTGEHHYYFKVYALDRLLDLPAGSTKAQVEAAMHDHVLASGQMIGLYQKGK